MKRNIQNILACLAFIALVSLPGLVILGPVILMQGCATLQPGADPIVVHAEQVEKTASSTITLLFELDDADRGFWKTNAPALHRYVEWLRQPQRAGTNTLARGYAMVWNLNEVKNSYKASKVNSNALYSTIITLDSAVTQSLSWINIMTNSPSH